MDFNLNVFVIIIASGILGNLLDSLLGSLVQVKFICKICRKVVEAETHCGVKTNYYKGFQWIDNNVVNFIASFSGILFFILLKKIF